MQLKQLFNHPGKSTADYSFYGLLVVLALATFYVMLFATHSVAGQVDSESHSHPTTSNGSHAPSHN